MKSLWEILLTNHFDELMQTARAAGWWVTLDYREEGPTAIYANHSGLVNRQYQAPASHVLHSFEDYSNWFDQCAHGLMRAAELG